MRALCSVAITAALLGMSGHPARADSAHTTTVSYRRYTLVADLASVGLMAGGLLANDTWGETTMGTGAFFVGFGGLLVAAPVVHGVRGHGLRGVGSFALRAGFGLTGALIGDRSARGCGGDFCFLGPAVIGFGVGLAAAIVVDAALLTDEPLPPRPAPTFRPMPVLSLNGIGLAGTF